MTPTTVAITLSSGSVIHIVYQWTFDGMAITAALLVLIVLVGLQWVYDIVYQLWTWRRM